MAEPLSPGDLVVCVNTSPLPRNGPGNLLYLAALKVGRCYTVSWVGRTTPPEYLPIIRLAGIDHGARLGIEGWHPERFRKIDKADEGFTAWMKAMRPKQTVRGETPSSLNLEGERG